MSLYVLENEFGAQVIKDLRTICPDPGLSVDIGTSVATSPDGGTITARGSGKVTYVPTRSSVGCNVVATLVNASAIIGIRGERSSYPIDPAPISSMSGISFVDKYPAPSFGEALYDAEDCNGRGHWVQDINATRIPYPTHVSLFHELCHVYLYVTNSFSLGTDASAEIDTIVMENQFRDALGLPRRVGHGGGCNAAPPTKPPPKRGGGKGCFVASAAYESPMSEEVQLLRDFRDGVLRRTRTGGRFFDDFYADYERISPPVVEAMEADPRLRRHVRDALAAPIVEHLRTAVELPDAPLDGVPEPWRGFLAGLRRRLQDWATTAVEPPLDLGGLDPVAAATEVAIMLRYVLREEPARAAYLDALEAAGQLPIACCCGTEGRARTACREIGLDERLVARVLGDERPRRRVPALRGLSPDPNNPIDEVRFFSEINTSEWLYTVTLRNETTDAFDEIVMFYSRHDLPGVVFLRHLGVQPGEIRIFPMGVCSKMKSYAIGFFIGSDMVFRFPDSGNMTPALASQIKPSDVEPCADSWVIE